MNTPRFIAAFVCLAAFIPLRAQNSPAKADAISGLIKNSETDSIQYIERLAAFLFHEKLNEYRNAKQMNVLFWDDSLWLASRNHAQWMKLNNKLSHDEATGTVGFAGKSPGDRYLFVTSNNGKAQWCGENALYNYSAKGETANELAERIAQHSLEQWQASPGHNDNMLQPSAYVEGTAFIITGEQVWATSLFARKPINNAYEPVSFNRPGTELFNAVATTPSLSPVATTTTNPKPEKKQSTYQMEKSIRASITDGLYPEVETEKSLMQAAKSHASYMSMHKTSSSEEKKGKSRFTGKTPVKRVKKASHGMEFFKRFRTRVIEMTFYKTYPSISFSADQAAGDAKAKFSKERSTTGEVKSLGLDVKVKKLKNEYTVAIVVLERRSKSDDSEGTADVDF